MTKEIRYVKRLDMRFDFAKTPFPTAPLPDHFFWKPWNKAQIRAHARLIYSAFCQSVDSRVFPTFRDGELCDRLMETLASSERFLPGATWLVAREVENIRPNYVYCASIQGSRESKTLGAIQNVAVAPGFRRRGLGAALVVKALEGFRDAGCKQVRLEATEVNAAAVHLYARLGFKVVRESFVETFVEGRDERRR